MSRRPPALSSPLPPRGGIDAAWVRFPDFTPCATVGEYLADRYPRHWPRIAERIAAGEVVDASGAAISAQTPVARGMTVYFYRDLPVEIPVPFDVEVLHQDENLVVVDKPHFLASIPRGRHVAESALVRLRRMLDLPELSPVHRLDRLTAGVLVFTARAEVRGAYQTLFARRSVRKAYEAVAGFDPDLELPRTVRSRIIKERGRLQAWEAPGAPNAETRIELLRQHGDHALYRLRPHTGKTHQLRVHMSSLGMPIVGDNLYPDVRAAEPGDFSRPLQLLAKELAFTDPISGEQRVFTSRRTLAWNGAADAR
jgi:tRNA pseudouridine32 synthase/23S rRNA pseudouridine746 synthase